MEIDKKEPQAEPEVVEPPKVADAADATTSKEHHTNPVLFLPDDVVCQCTGKRGRRRQLGRRRRLESIREQFVGRGV